MAFTSILRKSGSSLAPLATRLVRGQGNYHHALFTAKTHSNLSNSHSPSFLSPLVPNLHYSSASKKPSSDETLLRVIQSEIQCLQENDDHDRVVFFFFNKYFWGLGAVWLLRMCGKMERRWKNPPQCRRMVVFGHGKNQ